MIRQIRLNWASVDLDVYRAAGWVFDRLDPWLYTIRVERPERASPQYWLVCPEGLDKPYPSLAEAFGAAQADFKRCHDLAWPVAAGLVPPAPEKD